MKLLYIKEKLCILIILCSLTKEKQYRNLITITFYELIIFNLKLKNCNGRIILHYFLINGNSVYILSVVGLCKYNSSIL